MQNRSPFRGLWFWTPVCLALIFLACCNRAHAIEPQLVATPRAEALPVSATNRPFLAADHAGQAVALAAAGYAETEYVVSGQADLYDWSGTPQDAQVAVRAADVPYATRILVRRPTDPKKFSGIAVVELLDAAGGYDVAPLWGLSSAQFLRRGDVWVGVTVQPAGAAALAKFDPVRYGAVSFAYHEPADCHVTAARNDPPDTDSGLAWDLIAQVGALLRSSSKENPLLDLNPRFLVAAGYAQGGGYIATYANAIHRVLRRGDGAPIYDGFLAAASAPAAPLSPCAAPLPDEDPRRTVLPRDVPFVVVATESDVNRVSSLRRDDSDAPEDRFRRYDIAGSAAAGPFAAGMPDAADLRIAGFAPPATDLCKETASDFPAGLAFNAIWQQYEAWLATGVAMANVPRLETFPDGTPRRDEAGNASGGWRLPQIEVPLARYAGYSTPRDGGDRAAARCAFTGSMQPFDAKQLKALYHNRAEYLKRLRAAVDQAVAERRLTVEDGAALKTSIAQAAPAF